MTVILNAMAIGTVPTAHHSAACTVIPMSDANNSKAALFDKENTEGLRNSSRRAHSWTNMADGSIGGQ